jgi:hypothetical protein
MTCCGLISVSARASALKRLTRILVKRFYQYFVEYKKSEPEIYVIRDGRKINYAEIKKEIEIQ